MHLADALHGEGCRFGAGRVLLQRGGVRFRRGVAHFQRGNVPIPRKLRRIGQPDGRIERRFASHGHGAFGHCCQRGGADVRGRDIGLPLPDHHAQAEVDPFGAFGLFQHTAAHVDGHGGALHRHGVGGIRPRAARRIQQGGGEGLERSGGHGRFSLLGVR